MKTRVITMVTVIALVMVLLGGTIYNTISTQDRNGVENYDDYTLVNRYIDGVYGEQYYGEIVLDTNAEYVGYIDYIVYDQNNDRVAFGSVDKGYCMNLIEKGIY